MGAHFFLPTQLTYRLANALVDIVVGHFPRGDGCKKPVCLYFWFTDMLQVVVQDFTQFETYGNIPVLIALASNNMQYVVF